MAKPPASVGVSDIELAADNSLSVNTEINQEVEKSDVTTGETLALLKDEATEVSAAEFRIYEEEEEELVVLDIETIPVNTYLVTRVIDGDTIEVATENGGKRVRYIGIDTPETVHPSKPVECFGKEASDKNRELVEGKWVRLEGDVSDTDRYGRWLRYVYVDDVFINELLVAEGYANVVTYPPDVLHTELFRESERIAREQGLGLWGSMCQEWVAPTAPPISSSVPVTSQTPPNGSCVIKGNINSKKEKIYHYPDCRSYDQTLITEETGERWFCTEAEAIDAGWRKAGNC